MSLIYFTKTSIGYSHLNCGKLCQDFSATYHDDDRTVITACDGHGGNIYVRSHKGSQFASDAIMHVFTRLKSNVFSKLTCEEVAQKLRLNILCEWNALVEKDVVAHPFDESELATLSDEERFRLKSNGVKAYGSTLNGAMVLGDKLVCVNLGDGGVFLLNKGAIAAAFDEEDEEPVANVTFSLCQEDAYKHIKVGIFDVNTIDGVLICTDGLVNPYQNVSNFNQSFVQPVRALANRGRLDKIEQFVVKFGAEIGIGDDVSLGLMIFKK